MMQPLNTKNKFLQQILKEQETILCDGCTKMIKENQYINHWNQCISKKRKQKIGDVITKKQENQNIRNDTLTNNNNTLLKETTEIKCNKCQQKFIYNARGQEIHKCPEKQQICRCGENFPLSLIRQHQAQCLIRKIILQSQKQSKKTQRSKNQRKSKRIHSNKAPIRTPALGEKRSQNQFSQFPDQTQAESNGPHSVEQYYWQSCFGQETQENQDLLEQLFEMFKKRERLSDQQLRSLTKKLYDPKTMKKDEECTICQQPFIQGQEIVILECQHMFHSNDIFKWLKSNSTCPNCKTCLKKNK